MLLNTSSIDGFHSAAIINLKKHLTLWSVINNNIPLSWFETYLLDRKQKVQLKSEGSDELPDELWRATRKYPGTATVYILCQRGKHSTKSKYAELSNEYLPRLLHTK